MEWNGMSIREAAETFGIPQSSLGDKLCGKSAPTATVRGKDRMPSRAVEDRQEKLWNIYFYFICLIAVV